MNLSLFSTCELWRRLNPLSSECDRDEKRRAAIVAELRSRHKHLVTNTRGVVTGNNAAGRLSFHVPSSIPYPWELHV